jgi:carboxyl-terminal processing protease
MKKIVVFVALLFTGLFGLQSCDDIDDTDVPVYDFIYKGLNLYYLWLPDVPELADNRFSNQQELNYFLQAYSTPEELFRSLLYRPGRSDRFSVIFSDYNVLENALQGVTKSNGVEFGLVYTDASETTVVGYVRYILPGTDAATKNIQRGDIFYAVNGTPLTATNYQSLLGADTYTLNLATVSGGVVTPTGEDVQLTKAQYSENPVYTTQVFTEGSHTIGYLMYNGFYSNYDTDLNNAFGQLAAQNINDLVLDLRYNSGGSVRTATYLGSMITGQYAGQVFSKQQWNPKIQAYYESNSPESLVETFATQLTNGAPINSLNLRRIYILTSASTASASELIINCLRPYIDVVVIGDMTTGKNVGSITLYDSPDFSRENRETSHRYAMQPIVLKTLNKQGYGDYDTGLRPGTLLKENISNLGTIGDRNEPLLATAIGQITGMGRRLRAPENEFKQLRDSKNINRFGTEMYIETPPPGSINLLKNLQ